MSEQDRAEQEPGALSGDVVPTGPGAWMSYAAAGALWKIKPKAVYRRITRGQAIGRKNPETGEAEVWVPQEEERRERERGTDLGEPGHFLVPDQQARLLALLDKATATLGQQVQQLTEEREQANRERDQAIRERDEERQRADTLAAELARRDARQQRKWWRRVFGGG